MFFDIRINAVPSNFFGYVINSSRVYWRKELEYNFDDQERGGSGILPGKT